MTAKTTPAAVTAYTKEDSLMSETQKMKKAAIINYVTTNEARTIDTVPALLIYYQWWVHFWEGGGWAIIMERC